MLATYICKQHCFKYSQYLAVLSTVSPYTFTTLTDTMDHSYQCLRNRFIFHSRKTPLKHFVLLIYSVINQLLNTKCTHLRLFSRSCLLVLSCIIILVLVLSVNKTLRELIVITEILSYLFIIKLNAVL